MPMFFLDTYPRYYLASADFAAHPELSLQEKTRLVIEEYQKELRAYYEKEELNPPMASAMSRYFIILWRNLPKTNIDDNTEDTLFEMMCQSMANFKDTVFEVVIRDINVLADHSIEKFIRRLCMIKKYASIKPIFLDNTTDTLLTPKLESTSDDDIKALAIQTAFSAVEYDRLIAFLENMYISVKEEPIESATKEFIYYYYQIQQSKMVIAAVVDESSLNRRTLYRYFDEFEQHPYFPEYCKLYPELIDKPKKRPLAFDLESFYKEATPIFTKGSIGALALDKDLSKDFWKQNTLLCDIAEMKVDDLLEKYSLTCSIDAYRTWLAVKKKLKIK